MSQSEDPFAPPTPADAPPAAESHGAAESPGAAGPAAAADSLPSVGSNGASASVAHTESNTSAEPAPEPNAEGGPLQDAGQLDAGQPGTARKRRRRKRKRAAGGSQTELGSAGGADGSAPAELAGSDEQRSDDHPRADGESQPSGAAQSPGALSAKEIDYAARAVQFLGKHSATLAAVLTPEVQELLTQPEADRTIYERLQGLLGKALAAENLGHLDAPERQQLTREALDACPTVAVLCAHLEGSLGQEGSFDILTALDPLRRCEAARVTPEQLQQLLSISLTLVPQAQRLEWLVAALENRELKRAFDAEPSSVPPAFQNVLPQAKALLSVVVRGQTLSGPLRVLRDGLRATLRAGARSLRTRSVAIRERFIQLALEQRLKEQESIALEGLLETLSHDDAGFELELLRIRGWLATGQLAQAEARLAHLASKGPARGPVGHWLKALSGPRFGNLALLKSRVNPPLAHALSLRPGFSFSDQNDVWVRVGAPEEAAQFVEQHDVHRRALLPCVTRVHDFGFTNSRRPFIAYSRKGESARYALTPARGLSRREALGFAHQLLQMGFALARAGVVLPDAELGRFELNSSGQLWLVETWGSRIEPSDKALEAMIAIVRQWQLAVLTGSSRFELPREARENFLHAGDFETVRAALESLSRTHYWGE